MENTKDLKEFSFEELLTPTANKVRHAFVEAYGGVVKLATVSSFDVMQWLEDNDRHKSKHAGLRLAIMSMAAAAGRRLTPDALEEALKSFLDKASEENEKVSRAALELMGFRKKQPTQTQQTDAKNDSSEANSDASRTDSPSPSAV